MIENVDINRALEDSSLFRDLKTSELDIIAGLVREGSLERGQHLFHEGDPSEALYIIRSGAVAIEKALNGSFRLQLARLGPGEIFGEIGLICRAPRSADAVALEALSFWVLARSDYERLLANQAALASRLLHGIAVAISQRLIATNQLLMKLIGQVAPAETTQLLEALSTADAAGDSASARGVVP
ncbi:MAG: cyclic nucleotide-binding domain-containing protein [Candidatus Riflebacteria bacterium]|nr:cyclic nucleotide-binding domain-containing protein [Candidatus Riflebacteria bacterium]